MAAPERYELDLKTQERTAGAEQGGNWVTLGGGAPAMIDDGGNIVKGCPGLKGHNVDELDATREHREQKQDAAERAGISGEDITVQDAQQSDGDWDHLEQVQEVGYLSIFEIAGADPAAMMAQAPQVVHGILGRVADSFAAWNAAVSQYGGLHGGGNRYVWDAWDNVGRADVLDALESLDQIRRNAPEWFDVPSALAHLGVDQPAFPADADEWLSPEEADELQSIQERLGDYFSGGQWFGGDALEYGEPATVDDRHAAASAAHASAAPGVMKPFIGSMLATRDVQETGRGATSEIHPDYAKQLHQHIQGLLEQGGSDGFGEAADLGGHLGAGAVGYHSPAGIVAMVPPRTKGGDWEARFSLPVPERKQEPEKPEKPKRQPKQIVADPKLRKMLNEWGMPQEDQSAFSQMVDDVWGYRRDLISRQNDMIRSVVGTLAGSNKWSVAIEDSNGNRSLAQVNAGSREEAAARVVADNPGWTAASVRKDTGSASALMRKLRNADDYDKIPGFDEMAQTAQNNYPELFGMYGGQFGSTDPEYVLWQVLQRGQQPIPRRTDDDIIEEALQTFAQWEKSKAAPEPDDDGLDFDRDMPQQWRRRGWVERYAMPQGTRWRELYARWQESDHPRGIQGRFIIASPDRHEETHEGTRDSAIARARSLYGELKPTHGVQVWSEDCETCHWDSDEEEGADVYDAGNGWEAQPQPSGTWTLAGPGGFVREGLTKKQAKRLADRNAISEGDGDE